MYYKRCLSALLQTPLYKILLVVLGLIILVHFFTYYGHPNFSNITRDEVITLLYKAVNPNLKVESTTDCKYDFLKSPESLDSLSVPRKYDNFSAAGIVNGSYYPRHCRPRYSVAVLVTYRNRQEQLDIFVPYMHNFLRRQNIHYKLYVIEQQDEEEWNKGMLYNIGARVAIAEQFPCLVLHDVDLLPLDRANMYACLPSPRHMSASIDKFRFVLPYRSLVGGVTSLRADQFVLADGLSNRYRGWGGEDDDFANRLQRHQLQVLRVPREMSRYTMLVHPPSAPNPSRLALLRSPPRGTDGYGAAPRAPVRVRETRLFTLVGVTTR